jgi:hypothetical protein
MKFKETARSRMTGWKRLVGKKIRQVVMTCLQWFEIEGGRIFSRTGLDGRIVVFLVDFQFFFWNGFSIAEKK